MNSSWKDRCVQHRGADATEFISAFFAEQHRKAFLIAGAGFDPRSSVVPISLSRVMGDRLSALFIREERRDPDPTLVKHALQNVARLVAAIPLSKVEQIDIFAVDGAIVGGRDATIQVSECSLEGITDIIVDLSALSIGVTFPIIRYLYDKVHGLGSSINLHLFVTDEPNTDVHISSTPCDIVQSIHGFNGGFGLDVNARAAKLWLPQLADGRGAVLDLIHSAVKSHDVCPILPFPCANPRRPDELIEQYIDQFESKWHVDPRSIIYAQERNPLDLYRTILRIDDVRRKVFEEVGGSLLILSPTGGKVLSIGILLAAIERNFPVFYVEAVAYSVDFVRLDNERLQPGDTLHLWLHGEAYLTRASAEK